MTAAASTSPPRVLIVRLGAMGDIIHALPVVAAIRRAQPDIEIGWVIEKRWVELLSTPEAVVGRRSPQKPLVDHIHFVNTRAWRSALTSGETWREIFAAVRGIRQQHYDVALDFQGAWKSGFIVGVSGASSRVGFSEPREHGASVFYTHAVDVRSRHVIEQNLELAEAARLPLASPPRDFFPHDPAAAAWCGSTLRERGMASVPFAIMNPGAGWGAKQWPLEKYAEVARGLAGIGMRTVVNFGPAEEAMARNLESLSHGAATAIACSVGELMELTRRAALFIGGDTGPMHMAAALRVPVVGIFGPTDPARNGPFATEAIVLRRAQSVTNHSRRASPDEAMLRIEAAEVLGAAGTLLRLANPHSSTPSEAHDA